MGNKSSTISNSDTKISNNSSLYSEAITKFESSLQQYSEVLNTIEIGDRTIVGNNNTIQTEFEQKASASNYMAASDAISTVLTANASTDDKIATLSDLYNDAIQKGGILSKNDTEAISKTDVENNNNVKVIQKLENAISLVQQNSTKNSILFGSLTVSGNDNKVLDKARQTAENITKQFNEMTNEITQTSDSTKKSDTSAEDKMNNSNTQKGAVSNAADELSSTAQSWMHSFMLPVVIIGGIVVFVIVICIFVFFLKNPDVAKRGLDSFDTYNKLDSNVDATDV